MPTTVDLTPRGQFDLAQSIGFGFGQREAVADGSLMRLAFVLDGYESHAGVVVRHEPSGSVSLDISVSATDQVDVAAAQASRVLSLDVDASGYDELGHRDSLVGSLQAARPGLRPPLFHSAYEALAWAVLSARRPRAQMAKVRDELAATHGSVLELAGQSVAAFPTPAQLLGVSSFAGLSQEKVERLHGIARAALDGRLDTAALRGLPADEATSRLRELPGIGPFYAELVLVRALGHTDILPTSEPQLLALAGQLVGADRPLTSAELADRAQAWSPWRTWVCVAIRAAGRLVSGAVR